ncbi:MAG: energy-dependent translational throttle protein EttA [Myxococcales bacterium]|nr:energy-dependent translational throttle protein EttA [Myxococcales bacterium]
MAEKFVFTMNNVRKVVPPEKTIIKGMTLAFLPGAKIGVIGLNGSGKSSLLKIMAGVDTEFFGETWKPEDLRIGYLPQEPVLDETLDVRGNVELALQATRDLLTRYEQLNERLCEELDPDEMEQVLNEVAEVQEAIENNNGWEIDSTLDMAMDALRLPPGDMDVSVLSGGEKRRVALCRLLLEKPDMLLLDEPTNHLDAETVAWLEKHLQQFEGTVVSITHDRYFLDNVAGWILEMDRGDGIPWKGNYTSWLEQKEQRLSQEEKQQSARRKPLARELEWVRMNPKARQAKSKARIHRYEELLAQDAGAKEAEKLAEIVIPAGPRLGSEVVVAENVRKAYGDKLLIDDLSFRLPPGGIVGIIGANGAGKTTLFRMITDQETPDEGAFRIGDTVQIAYVDQTRDALDPELTIWEEISGGQPHIMVGTREVNSRAYVSKFNFSGADQQKRVGTLSGGERNRVHLAKLLRTGGNLLLLDEPTNDLDVDTLRALEEALLDFAGCAVIISHDRWFLDRIATHILAFEGDSQVVWFEGNYADYEIDRRRRLGAAADQPHRIKYRRLSR